MAYVLRYAAQKPVRGAHVHFMRRQWMKYVAAPGGSNPHMLLQHIVDSAFVYHCLSYGNSEPSSGRFRIRALPGKRFVTADFSKAVAMSAGTYRATPQSCQYIKSSFAAEKILRKYCAFAHLRPLESRDQAISEACFEVR